MHRMAVRALAALWLVGIVGLSVAQDKPAKEPPKDKPKPAATDVQDGRPLSLELHRAATDGLPKTLDEMLAVALKENPDIRVAEAKLRGAEEEVRRARLVVSQKIVVTYYGIAEKRAMVNEYTERWNTAERLRTQGSKLISDEEYRGAKASLEFAKAELAKLQAELPYLLGRAPTTPHRVELRLDTNYLNTSHIERLRGETELPTRYAEIAFVAGARAALTGDTAEKLRAALDKPLNMTFKKTPMANVAQELQTWTGVAVQLAPGAEQYTLTADFSPLPLGAAFQLLEDAEPNIRFVVRDYGILAVVQTNMPPGAVTVHDFWKASKQKPGSTEPAKAK
jgi:hypothetical protein